MTGAKGTGLVIREAKPEDVGLILSLIRELAEYEHLSDEVIGTEEILRESLFGPERTAEVLIAECDHQTAGFAVFFHTFSTFLGRRGIYLEDLFVRPDFRRRGIGRALLVHLARLAVERRCGRLEWAVLDWNEPAIRFYKSLRAAPVNGWKLFRLTGDPLKELAEDARAEE